MYRIIDSKSSGKTNRLLLLAKENQAIFVCADPYTMENKARGYGLVGIDFISYGDFYGLSLEKKYNNVFVIDELEKFATYNQGKIIGYTLSNE